MRTRLPPIFIIPAWVEVARRKTVLFLASVPPEKEREQPHAHAVTATEVPEEQCYFERLDFTP